MVDAIENKAHMRSRKSRSSSQDRQQTLAIRWILEAAFKRRISYRISLEKCSFAEILDAYRKRELHVRKGESSWTGFHQSKFRAFQMVTTFLILLPSFIELEESIP
uniref:Small ribosomal subunit protein uS7 domain-containing protein n=1 Tax=Salix viminalis TaxID=40686 RepID=A0A6N2K932_SALVM